MAGGIKNGNRLSRLVCMVKLGAIKPNFGGGGYGRVEVFQKNKGGVDIRSSYSILRSNIKKQSHLSWVVLWIVLNINLPASTVKPIDLAEAVRFELTEGVNPRQFSRLLHSTALPSFLLRYLLLVKRYSRN